MAKRKHQKKKTTKKRVTVKTIIYEQITPFDVWFWEKPVEYFNKAVENSKAAKLELAEKKAGGIPFTDEDYIAEHFSNQILEIEKTNKNIRAELQFQASLHKSKKEMN